MNELLEILARLNTVYAEIRERGNKALAGLQPLDQHEVAQPISFALRELEWGIERVSESVTSIKAVLDRTDQLAEDNVNAVLEELVKAEKVLKKEDHEAAVQLAEKAAGDAKKAEYDQKITDMTTVAARRKVAVEAHGSVAANISDEDLLAEDHEARVAVFAERMDKIKKLGLTEEKSGDAITRMSKHPLTDEGHESFESDLDLITAAAGIKKKPAAPHAPRPGQTPTVAASTPEVDDDDEDAEKPLVFAAC